MKTAFYSNYMNHHQDRISLKLSELSGEYHFIACSPIEKERLELGYEDLNKKYDFIIRAYEDERQNHIAEDLACKSDIVIFGSGDKKFLNLRMNKTNKMTFYYSERLFKKGTYRRLIPSTYKKIKKSYLQYKDNLFYLLCSSAYTSYDLKLCGFSEKKCFKWGYFPECKKYDLSELMNNKTEKEIIWVGRFIEFKHPEYALKVAKELKNENIDFHITMIGTGKKLKSVKKMIEKNKLNNYVDCLGSMSANEVRKYMEKSAVFIFTSDFREGWGAVLNEAMNSACACVASHAIGSAPYLIENGKNGFIYENANLKDLLEKVKYLLENPSFSKIMGINAYKTITNEWNSDVACERLICLYEDLKAGYETRFNSGPCSKAEVLKNNWYRH